MSGAPTVGIAIPARRSAGLIGETLASALGQSHTALRLVVSVDGDDAGTAAACAPFEDDPRVRVVTQPVRLGWLANSAAALAEAARGADFACILAHDDIIDEDYVAALAALAGERPDAAVVFSDVAMFGDHTGILSQPSVEGTGLARLTSLLIDHYLALPWRGLARTRLLAGVAPIAGNTADDFAADQVWVARLATVGSLVRLPRALYRKRYHPGNTSRRWARLSDDEVADAWTVHCLDMLAEALEVAESPAARRLVTDAARFRLLEAPAARMPLGHRVEMLGRAARAAMGRRFEAGAARLLEGARGVCAADQSGTTGRTRKLKTASAKRPPARR